ncbi:MAG TPA: CHAD domain-containing protein [Pseudomonadales bacterium]|nr:CHAD domain-containing protein [Pseudomonadales bacterium]
MTSVCTSESPWCAVLDARVASYRQQLLLSQQAMNVDVVHDLRVAIRRLLALLELLHRLQLAKRHRKLRRRLQQQLKGLGDLRDTQVMCAALPVDSFFTRDLHAREQQLLAAANSAAKKFPSARLFRRFEKIRVRLAALDDASVGLAFESCCDLVDEAFAVVLARHAEADIASPASIHRERIAFKRFRYSAEIACQLGLAPRSRLARLRTYQTLLGAIQDADVLLVAMEQAAPVRGNDNIQPLLQRQRRRHKAALARFSKRSDALLSSLWLPVRREGCV